MNFLRKIAKRILVDRTISRKSKWGSWWNYRHGFLQSTVDVCGISKSNYKDFVSDRSYRMKHPINGAYSSIIDNKLWLPLLLHDFLDFCPKYYFYKDEFGFLKFGTNQRTSVTSVVSLIKEKGKVACKHTHSSLGMGFFILEYSSKCFKKNNEIISEEEVVYILNSLNQYIITEFVVQHEYSDSIAKESLNTLRLLTVWDSKEKCFRISRAFHRFGANGNVVDNIGSGSGVLVFVDVERGVLTGEGAINFKSKGDKYMGNIIHPDSKKKLSGLEIPRYKEICEKILEISNKNSYLRYIGWDIAITENSFKIIETNSLSSLDVIQQRKGFLKDPLLKQYFK